MPDPCEPERSRPILRGMAKRRGISNEEFEAIERQAMGPAEPPRKVEVGSAESAFDNPPAR
jgi:hypothetical protein